VSGVFPAAVAALSCLLAGIAANRMQRDLILERAGRVQKAGAARRESLLGRRTARVALWGVVVVASLGLGGAVAGAPGVAAVAVAALVVPRARRRRARTRRAELVAAQLTDAVSGVATRLRAGLSLTQAIWSAVDEIEEPLGPSLRELVDRTTLGMPFDESVERWAATFPSAETRLVGCVLTLHRKTGGDAPAVLDQVARTLGERRAAAREIRSLTAQARLSGAILGLLPIGFFLFLSATSRGDMAVAYRSPGGAAAILAGLSMQAAAFVWIRWLLRVEP
jgi:tight adherence protein B